MLRNYLLIAWRNLWKNRLHSFINVTGLAIGLAACLIILAYVRYELSFDKHHPDSERIYRIALKRVYPEREIKWAIIAPAVAPSFAEQLPEVEEYTRLFLNEMLIGASENTLYEEQVVAVDSSFFDIFAVPVVNGSIANFFKRKDGAVLSETTAKRFFGEENPIGKTLSYQIQVDGQDIRESRTVFAIVADALPTSHFSYDILFSIPSLGIPDEDMQTWGSFFGFYSYLRLSPDADPATVEAKMKPIVDEHMFSEFDEASEYQSWLEQGHLYHFFLQPLNDIHLHSQLRMEFQANSSANYVYLFSAIAFFVLLIATVNFMNLATARAAQRTREVGVRKAVGAGRSQLITQFLIESTLISFFALWIALPLVQFVLPYFNQITGKTISMHFLLHPMFVVGLIFLPIAMGILAGSYPAFYLSAFRPTAIFRKERSRSGNRWLRHALVVGQFVVAIVLIVGTFTVFRQMRFLSEKSLGFNQDQVVVLDRAWWLEDKSPVFRREALQLPGVEAITFSGQPFGKISSASTYRPTEKEQWVNMNIVAGDGDFLKTMEIRLLAGRNFLPDEIIADDGRPDKVLLNNTAAHLLGWTSQEAVGQSIIGNRGDEFVVVGVVEDFHFTSLHHRVGPLQIIGTENWLHQTAAYVRIAPQAQSETVAALEALWKKYAPNKVFRYRFLDESLAGLYEAEHLTGNLFLTFSGLAILVCCLGLFGLMAFVTERRTKEIGIRKVLGAKVSQIILLLSRDFLRLVFIATLIAAPLAWFSMEQWLENFAFRVNNPIWVLWLAGVLTTIIAWLTVGFHAFRSAHTNPSHSLRQE